LADALDHRIVIEGVGQDQTIRNQFGDGRDASLIGDIARSEDERGLLAVEIGKLSFELDQRMIGAGDVARAAGPGAETGGGFDHGAHDLRVLPHAEIIVGAPDDDFLRPLRRVPHGVRKSSGYSLEVGEDAVAPLDMQTRESVGKETVKARSARLPKPSLRIGHVPLIGGPNRPIEMTAQTLAPLRALCGSFFVIGRSGSLIGLRFGLAQF
jgi:hypothetical protein